MLLIKDKVIVGALVGILADAIKLLSNYIMFRLDLTYVVFWQITASRFLEKPDLFKPVVYLVGGVADVTVTSLLGVVFIYVLYLTGKDYLWIKGIGFGMLVWVGLFGTLLGESVQKKIPHEPSGIIVTIIAHLVFGLSLALFAKFLYQDEAE